MVVPAQGPSGRRCAHASAVELQAVGSFPQPDSSGNKGRTIRVFVERCRIVFKEAGGAEVPLLGAAAA